MTYQPPLIGIEAAAQLPRDAPGPPWAAGRRSRAVIVLVVIAAVEWLAGRTQRALARA